jgi:hypothetical protein
MCSAPFTLIWLGKRYWFSVCWRKVLEQVGRIFGQAAGILLVVIAKI